MRVLHLIPSILFANSLFANGLCENIPNSEKVLFRQPVSMTVIGAGRLYFHSSTSKDCTIRNLFIVPHDSVIGYGTSTDDKWTEVMYIHPVTQKESVGWVATSRLKIIGKIAPSR